MQNVPVVNSEDHKRGIIAALVALFLTLFLLFFIKWHEPDPPKVTKPIPIIMEDGIDDFEIYNAGGGAPAETVTETRDPEPTPQEVPTQQESSVQVPTGSNQANAESTTTSQVEEAISSPFSGTGTGGSGTSGTGTGFGRDSGPGSGSGEAGSGGSGERVRLNNLSSKPKTINNNICNIALKLTVDSRGVVVHASVIRQNTTTTNQTLIDEVIELVKKEVKYKEKPGARNEIVYYTVTVKPS